MRILVTGATGYIGSAVVSELVRAGHEVTGLVRSKQKAASVQSLGAGAVEGTLEDPASYRGPAAEHEALCHIALERSSDRAAADATAIETLLRAAREGGRVRLILYTSGCWVLGHTGEGPADEDASTDGAAEIVRWRPAHERRVRDAASGRLATAVLRPGVVYGGKGGLVSQLFASAVERGAAEYVGDGQNRWSLIHRDDLARLYRQIVETGGRGIFHAAEGRAVRVADAARAASAAAGARGATRSLPLSEARKELGLVADALCLDQVIGARRSRELGWRPTRTSFVESATEAFREWRA